MNIEKHRIALSRVFVVMLLTLVLFTHHSWNNESFLDIVMEIFGLALIVVGVFGRVWSFLYICGRKTNDLVTQGPYSVTRNPLYVFSFLGAVGLGLASENIVVLGFILLAFLGVYPFVILSEENRLTAQHGEAFFAYAKRVPRFIPNTLKIDEPERYEVFTKKFKQVIFDGMWFVWIFIFMHFVESLHEMGYLPILWRLP